MIKDEKYQKKRVESWTLAAKISSDYKHDRFLDKTIKKDNQKYKNWSPEGRPRLPENYSALLDNRTTRTLMNERIKNVR
jgi:hypothetical protein